MMGAVGVFLVSKGLQLSQVQHGLNHHLQRAHATRPAPPRTPRGVRSDLADNSMLEKMDRRCISWVNHDFYCKRHEWKLTMEQVWKLKSTITKFVSFPPDVHISDEVVWSSFSTPTLAVYFRMDFTYSFLSLLRLSRRVFPLWYITEDLISCVKPCRDP